MSGRRRTVRRAAGLAALVALAGCGIPTGLAVDSMVPILENTATAARERTDLTLVGAGFPGNPMMYADADCCGATDTHNHSWGRIKTLYR